MSKRKTKKTIKQFIQVAGAIIFIGAFLITQVGLFKDRTVISFFDVGQGDATHIRSNDVDVLVDGGRSNTVLERLGGAMPFFDRTIELMVLTHPDFDHHFGLVEVIKRYTVDTILESAVACDKKLCDTWDVITKGYDIDPASKDLLYEIPHGNVDVLYPLESVEGVEVKDLNDTSVVVCVTVHEKTFLLMGDASTEIEDELIDAHALGNCEHPDVLKLGHHGSKTATSQRFIEHLTPKYAIISAGAFNDYGHPHFEVLARLKEADIQILRTDTDGTIRIEVTEDGLNIEKEI